MAKFLFEGTITPLEEAAGSGCVPLLIGGLVAATALTMAFGNTSEWVRHNYIQNKQCGKLTERKDHGQYVYLNECETLIVKTESPSYQRGAFAVRYTFDRSYSWHRKIGWNSRKDAIVPVVLEGEYAARRNGFTGDYFVWVDHGLKVYALAPTSETSEPELLHIATIEPGPFGNDYRITPTIDGMEHVRIDQQWFLTHFAK